MMPSSLKLMPQLALKALTGNSEVLSNTADIKLLLVGTQFLLLGPVRILKPL